jgi:ABC-2 type transport system ATP-binding protein
MMSDKDIGLTAAPATIQVQALTRSYTTPEREAGLRAAVKSLVRRRERVVRAVDGISFQIEPGEIVGFLGPNGAGKTTTLKMLAGLLYPTSGEARVLGYVPWKREPAFLRQMTLVMGNRQQLSWDLPAIDSFELFRAIYGLPQEQYRQTLAEFLDLLELRDLVQKPVRNLSLGERMKMEIVGALLHRPRVLFLDEPTIGLDVTMQKRIRRFVAEYNRRTGATVLLTSHYMADVEALCRRVIVIHRGHILFDGDLSRLAAQFGAYQTVSIRLESPAADLESYDLAGYGQEVGREDGKVLLRMAKADTSRMTARLLQDHAVTELTIEDPPIEDVIEQVFADEAAQTGPGEAGR